MKYRAALFVFALALVSDICLLLFDQSSARFISKPFIVSALVFFLAGNIRPESTSNRILPLTALVFSLLGDILLLFESRSSIYFLLGLSSFLLAHVFYILALNKIRREQGIPLNGYYFIPVLIYYAVLLFLLYPRLGELKVPVTVYGAVISTMLVIALHLNTVSGLKAGTFFLGGAVLFVLSDSLLAFNKFHTGFKHAGVYIMGTYGLAQLLLVLGFVRLSVSLKTLKT